MTEPHCSPRSRPTTLVGALALVGLLGAGCSESGRSSEKRTLSRGQDWAVFINEIHYDDVGPDVHETIEVAGRAGTDLSSFLLVLYDGKTGRMYDALQLEGTLSDEGAGYGALAFPLEPDTLQNGAPDGIALTTDDAIINFVSYEGSFTALDGPASGLLSVDLGASESSDALRSGSLQRAGTVHSSSWQSGMTASFGRLNVGQHFSLAEGTGEDWGSPELGACGATSTSIARVQGSGAVSPLLGRVVRVEGTVVAAFQGAPSGLGGFFLQAVPGDGDPRTSDALFIDDDAMAPVRVGDHVRVVGTIEEEEGMTRLAALDLASCGLAPLPQPVPLPLPYQHLEELEALEGMLVVGRDLYVTDVYDLGRLGQLTLTVGGRLFHPANGARHSTPKTAEHRIILDDGQNRVHAYPVLFDSEDGAVRVGDAVPELIGVLQDRESQFFVQPLDAATCAFIRTTPRPSSRVDVGGQLRIASLNLSNYFLTLGQRGADTPEELSRQREKIVSTIVGLNADILGLQELENRQKDDGESPSSLDDLVASVNAALGSDVYATAPDPAKSNDNPIRTALIYKPELLDPLPVALLESEDRDRSATAQAFSFLGDTFSVVVNHFKAKSGCPSESKDGNADEGQGCWNRRRTEQAQDLLWLVSQLQTWTADEDVVVLGDLNAYPDEDPIAVLRAGGLTNPVDSVPAHERYSYVFQGESGVLDYLMATPSVDVAQLVFWHINADEPPYLDYNMEHNPSSAYRPNPYRSSDHDPVVAGIHLTPKPRLVMSKLVENATELLRQPGIAVARRLRLSTLLTAARRAIERVVTWEKANPLLAAVSRSAARRALLSFTLELEALGGGPSVSRERVAHLCSVARRVIRALD